MAEQIVSDLLMKFVDLDDQPIPGESMTQLPKKKSPMMKGFDEQHMFELQSFTFKTGLGGDDMDEMAQKAKDQTDRTNKALLDHQKALEQAGIPTKGLRLTDPGFKKFRSGQMKENTRYPVDMKPIEFERAVDLTSPVLLWHCINRIPFKSATLIKRKAAGGPSSGEVFLRFDFNTVLISSVEWSDDAPVKETVEFVCRAVTIHYKPQLPDGTLGAPIPAFWKSSPRSNIKAEVISG